MELEPSTSRVLWRSIVSNWAEGDEIQDADDLLNDMLDGEMESFEIFRKAVTLKEPPSYLGRSEFDLVWCTPTVDIEKLHATGVKGRELLEAVGFEEIVEDAIEIIYPVAVAEPFYKPCALHAGLNPNFRPTSVDLEFGLTIGGLREAIHLPRPVSVALNSGARFRLWRIS